MVNSKLTHNTPRLHVLGTARETLLSQANPATKQAVRDLRETAQKVHSA